jgi:hypothetical protein
MTASRHTIGYFPPSLAPSTLRCPAPRNAMYNHILLTMPYLTAPLAPPSYDPTACANTLAARSLSILALSACGNSLNTLYTLFPRASLTAPSLFPATAPATAPGKFPTMKPIAAPLAPPIILQNLPVGCASSPSAMPSSRSISSNTPPN